MPFWKDFFRLWKASPSGGRVTCCVQVVERSKELSLNSYQQQAFTTAQYPEKGTGSLMAVLYTALGLGETGEIQGKIKKILRDQKGQITQENKDAIVAEISDLLWYVAALSTELGVSLGDVGQRNLDKLFDRQKRGVIQGSGDNR